MVPFERAFSFLVVGSSFVTCVAVIAEHSFLCSVHVVLLHLFCSITRASERINKLIKIKYVYNSSPPPVTESFRREASTD